MDGAQHSPDGGALEQLQGWFFLVFILVPDGPRVDWGLRRVIEERRSQAHTLTGNPNCADMNIYLHHGMRLYDTGHELLGRCLCSPRAFRG